MQIAKASIAHIAIKITNKIKSFPKTGVEGLCPQSSADHRSLRTKRLRKQNQTFQNKDKNIYFPHLYTGA